MVIHLLSALGSLMRSRPALRRAKRRAVWNAVSPSSAINLVRRWRETGSYAPGRVGGQKKRKLAGREDWLHAVMASTPDITLAELQKQLAGEGVDISQQAINTTLRALGYSYKKNPPGGGARSRRRCPKA